MRPAESIQRQTALFAVGLLLLPALHPLLSPLVGVPSHLLWFVHVLPVAVLTYRWGRTGAMRGLGASLVLVLVGERIFGAGFSGPAVGYLQPADWQTAVSLAVSLAFTNLLVIAFAIYARHATERWQLLFDRVKMGVLRVDGDGRIIQANPEAVEILERSPEELRGQRLTELFVRPSFSSMGEMAAAGPWSGRLEIAAEEGPSRFRHAFLATVKHPDAQGHQVLLSDRSLQVLQEQEIERQSKLAALGEALAGVAHELKNPLTTIIAHAQLGLMETEDDQARESLEIIDREGERMKELLGELLGFSRTEEGVSRTSIHRLIRRIVRVQRMALRKKVRLEERCDWEGELPVSPTKVEQILLNLISNAAYALKDDGGVISIGCRAVDGHVEVEVTDTGPGIEPRILPDIFQPFTTSKPPGEGTGLGLAISRRLARSWGGDLRAENRDEGGARFVLELPLTRPAPEVTPEPSAPQGGPEPEEAVAVLETTGSPDAEET